MVGDGNNRRTLIHINDLCRAAVLAGQHPDAPGQIYNVTDGQIYTMENIIEAIYAAYCKKPPRFKLPAGMLRIFFGLTEDGLGLLKFRSPVGRSTVTQLTKDLAISSEKIQKELGFKPQYSLLEGWRRVANQICKN